MGQKKGRVDALSGAKCRGVRNLTADVKAGTNSHHRKHRDRVNVALEFSFVARHESDSAVVSGIGNGSPVKVLMDCRTTLAVSLDTSFNSLRVPRLGRSSLGLGDFQSPLEYFCP